jgi:hypothetical protein
VVFTSARALLHYPVGEEIAKGDKFYESQNKWFDFWKRNSWFFGNFKRSSNGPG